MVAWNIPVMGRIVEGMRREGQEVSNADLGHVWPLAHRHVLVNGQYSFRFDETPEAA